MTSSDIRTAERFDRTWRNPPGLRGFFTVVQHKTVGTRYMVTSFVFFLVGGLQALLMRAQLTQPDAEFLSAQAYNELFTMHGTTMMFLFAIPFLEGLATYLLPLMIGARDMAFPRYNAFNYWCYLLGGVILYSSYLFAMVPSSGWFAYVPLSGPEFADRSMDFWLFGLTLAEIAAVGAAIEIVVSVLRCRAPGMTLNRMPIFAWTMLAVGLLIIVAFVPLLVGSVLLELDRVLGTAFFDQDLGGSPLLWQHLFWIFGHPEVYVMFLPGAAIISHVIPIHARHPIVAYPLIVIAIMATAVMSLGLWVHHMYTTGLPAASMGFFTAASMSITLASGLQVFAWIATLWLGRPRFTVPMLWSIGFIVTFVLGGITGVMVASVAFDTQAHDTYFIVAHFHYVLIGGMLFPLFAGLYHWWPKFTGRMYGNGSAVASFWLIFVGFHTTFFPMHLAGLWGMPRRVYTYEEELGLGTVNLISTIGAAIIGLGVLVMVAGLVMSLRRPRTAADDPWGGDTLEWSVPSPPPSENFRAIPVVSSRHPGWDDVPPQQAGADDPDLDAFDAKPEDYRAAPLTTMLTAETDSFVLLPRPTFWAIVPPAGLALVAVALLTQWYWLAMPGLIVLVVGLVGWGLRNESEFAERLVRPLAGGLRVETLGAAAAGWWGAAGASAVLLVGVATLTFSALFLQVNAAVWPEESTFDQPVAFATVTVLLVIAAVATAWGARQGRGAGWDEARPEHRQRHVGALSTAFASGAAALAVIVFVWSSGGLEPRAHAYDSSVWVMLAVAAFVTVVALSMTVAASFARVLHRRDIRAAMQLQNASILWATAVVAWLAAWLVSDVLPALVI